MDVFEATTHYEAWMRKCTPVVRAHLRRKHEEMRADLFCFLRGTFYRWAQLWPNVCSDVRCAPNVLAVGDLQLDPAARTVRRAGTPICLAAKEFAILEYFMRHPGEVLSRARFVEHVWDFARAGDSNIVDVYVRILREKIDRPFGTESIETVRGAGYRLTS